MMRASAQTASTSSGVRRCRSGCASRIWAGFAWGAGLEAAVQPQVLRRHFANAVLDERIHACDIGLQISTREAVPRRVEIHGVALSARQLAGDDGDHLGTGEPGQPRQRRESGGGYPEKRYEYGVVPALVLVGQVIEGQVVLQCSQHGLDALVLRNQLRRGEA